MEIKQDGGFRVIGITARTKNEYEFGNRGKIGPLWQRFYSEGLFRQIPKKTHGDDIIAIYHDYESDVNGLYTLLVGAKVEKGTPAPEGMVALDVPRVRFAKIPSEQGQTPDIIINTWLKIFGLTEAGELKRKYIVDFEYYDQRALNPNSAQIDIYISV